MLQENAIPNWIEHWINLLNTDHRFHPQNYSMNWTNATDVRGKCQWLPIKQQHQLKNSCETNGLRSRNNSPVFKWRKCHWIKEKREIDPSIIDVEPQTALSPWKWKRRQPQKSNHCPHDIRMIVVIVVVIIVFFGRRQSDSTIKLLPHNIYKLWLGSHPGSVSSWRLP